MTEESKGLTTTYGGQREDSLSVLNLSAGGQVALRPWSRFGTLSVYTSDIIKGYF